MFCIGEAKSNVALTYEPFLTGMRIKDVAVVEKSLGKSASGNETTGFRGLSIQFYMKFFGKPRFIQKVK